MQCNPHHGDISEQWRYIVGHAHAPPRQHIAMLECGGCERLLEEPARFSCAPIVRLMLDFLRDATGMLGTARAHSARPTAANVPQARCT